MTVLNWSLIGTGFQGMVRILTITVAVGQILLLIFNFLKMKKPLFIMAYDVS